MSHLATGPRRAFAIEMHGGAGNRQPWLVIVNVVPDQVGHGDRAMADRLAQRPAGNRAAITEISRSNGMKASMIADLVPRSFQIWPMSSPLRIIAWPLPS